MAAVAWLGVLLAAVPAVLAWLNLPLLRVPPRAAGPVGRVSVLVPARDEEADIGPAIESVLGSRGAELELVVLDDDSSDATARIVERYARRDARVRLVRGRGVEPGCWGKPLACAELAEVARGDVLLFMDADVRLMPDAAARIADALARSRAALLSGVPRQITPTLAEKLAVGLIHFVLLGFLPLSAMRASRRAGFGAACGQLVAVERDAYFRAGGHRGVANRAHDGIALARALRSAGFRTDLADFTPLATCRMYTSWHEVVAGFAKNAHEGLGSPAGIVPWSLALVLGHSAWPVVLVLSIGMPALLMPGALAAALSLGTRAALTWRYGHSWLGAALHPAGVAVLVGIQWYALTRRLLGRPVPWKRRAASAPRAGARPVPDRTPADCG